MCKWKIWPPAEVALGWESRAAPDREVRDEPEGPETPGSLNPISSAAIGLGIAYYLAAQLSLRLHSSARTSPLCGLPPGPRWWGSFSGGGGSGRRRDRGVRGRPSDQCVRRGGRRDGGREHACPPGRRHPPPAVALPSAARSPPRRARNRLLSARHPHQRDHRRDHPGGLQRHRRRRFLGAWFVSSAGDAMGTRGRPVPPHVQLACVHIRSAHGKPSKRSRW